VRISGFSDRAKLAFLFGLGAIVVVFLFWSLQTLLLIFLGLLIGIVLDAIASVGVRFLKMPRGVAVVTAAVLLLAACAGALSLLIVPLLREGTGFMEALPERTARFTQRIEQYREDIPWLKQFLPEFNPNESAGPKTPPTETAKKAVSTASSLLDWLFEALSTFFLALYLAWSPDRWLKGVAELWPKGNPDDRIAVYCRIGGALRSYLFSMAVYVVAMGTMWTIGLWMIGINYAILFGAIGGLVEIAPYIGPTLGLIPPLLFALTLGKAKVFSVLALYAFLHIIEGYVLVPYILHRKEHLPAPIVVLSLLIFGKLGLLGFILAVPLGTLCYVLANELIYKNHRAQA
jgi:predicted PurR-regulated permease PerM